MKLILLLCLLSVTVIFGNPLDDSDYQDSADVIVQYIIEDASDEDSNSTPVPNDEQSTAEPEPSGVDTEAPPEEEPEEPEEPEASGEGEDDQQSEEQRPEKSRPPHGRPPKRPHHGPGKRPGHGHGRHGPRRVGPDHRRY